MKNNMGTLCVHAEPEINCSPGHWHESICRSTAGNYLESNQLIYPGFFTSYNQQRLGNIMTALEGGTWGVAFNSGMAAITTAILSQVKQGDHIVFSRELYGGTRNFARQELPQRGIDISFAASTLTGFQALTRHNTRLFFIETPSNPLLTITPLKEIAQWARKRGIIVIVDNTFASPINQRPLECGTDIVVESGTKYLGGHSDLMFGVLVAGEGIDRDIVLATARFYGNTLAPEACFLAERSIKTLEVRVLRQNENAARIAEFLDNHQKIKRVHYPGLKGHPEHGLAARQMKGFGGIVTFEPAVKPEYLESFLKSFRLIRPAVSFGGVNSTISSPASTSHADLSAQERASLGISDSLLRLSVGIENTADLLVDLDHALGHAE